MESLTISCNKELMFSERALHPGDIPWTAFLSYPNGSAPLPSLDLQPVSASHSGKPRCAVLLQGWSRCPWFPIPTNKWALGWAHKHWWDQPWPAHACQRVPRTLFLAMDLIWTHHIAQKLQLRRHLKHSHYTLSTLFLNTCKKIPLPLQKKKKIYCFLWHLSPHFFHIFLCPVVVVVVIAAVTEMHEIMQLSSILI